MNSFKKYQRLISAVVLLLGINLAAQAACEAELEKQISANTQWNAGAIESQRRFHETTMRKGYVNETRTKSQITDSLIGERRQLDGARAQLSAQNNPTDRKRVEGWIADAEYAVCLSNWALKSAPEK